MTDYYFSKAAIDDTGDGLTQGTAKLTTSAARTLLVSDGNKIKWRNGDDWTGDTASASALLDFVGANGAITDWGTSGALPILGFASITATITTVIYAAGTATIATSAAHGMFATDYVQITGSDDAAVNGSWPLLTASGTAATFALGGAGTGNGGTLTRAWSSKACIANTQATPASGCSVSNVRLTKGKHGILTTVTAAGIAGFTATDVTIDHTGDTGAAHTGSAGTATGFVYTRCTLSYCRNDGINLNATGTGAFAAAIVTGCSANRMGYNADDTIGTIASGPGDGYSWHALNYGDVINSSASWCYQGGILHVTTTSAAGGNRAINNVVWEFSKTGIGNSQASAAAMTCFGNIVVAPVSATLQATNDHACVMHGNGTTGTGSFYNNTLITARGAASGAQVTTNVVCAHFSSVTGTVNFKNNACISNGTAGLITVSLTAVTSFVTATNYYSHTGSLFRTFNNSALVDLATWKTKETTGNPGVKFDLDAKSAGTNVVSGAAPTTTSKTTILASCEIVTGSDLRLLGTDLLAAGVTDSELPYDVNGRQRNHGSLLSPANWDIGAEVYDDASGPLTQTMTRRRRRSVAASSTTD